MKELCRKCGEELFEWDLLDGHAEMALGSKTRLESDGEKKFFTCPYCKAKNVTAPTTSKNGLHHRRITHVED